jgi:arginine deiminase
MTISFEEQIQDIASERAWSPAEVLLLALDFINEHDMNEKFKEWLQAQIEQEDDQMRRDDAVEEAMADVMQDSEDYDYGFPDDEHGINSYEPDEPY